jgi:hypothetical protein
MVTVALLVRIGAKPGQEATVEKFLKDGWQIVEGEPAHDPSYSRPPI